MARNYQAGEYFLATSAAKTFEWSVNRDRVTRPPAAKAVDVKSRDVVSLNSFNTDPREIFTKFDRGEFCKQIERTKDS